MNLGDPDQNAAGVAARWLAYDLHIRIHNIPGETAGVNDVRDPAEYVHLHAFITPG
jgi:hypothetical protein